MQIPNPSQTLETTMKPGQKMWRFARVATAMILLKDPQKALQDSLKSKGDAPSVSWCGLFHITKERNKYRVLNPT